MFIMNGLKIKSKICYYSEGEDSYMSEEQKKEEAPAEEVKAEASVEEVKVEAQSEAAGDDKVQAPSQEKATAEEKTKPEIVKPEKPVNCPVCKKSMKTKWYYRNLKYYCCKGCFKQDTKKVNEEIT